MENNQTRARIFAGIGAGLALGGGVLLIFNQRTSAAPPRDSASNKLEPPRLAFGCRADGCGAVAQGTFR